MLTFTYGGNDYRVRFARSTRTVETLKRIGLLADFHKVVTKNPEDEFVRRVVLAKIERKLPTGGFRVEASGISVCNPNDKFDPGKGRRLALNRAIKQKRKERGLPITDVLPKAMTTAMWDAYFGNMRDGKRDNGTRISAATSYRLSQSRLKLRRRSRAGLSKSVLIKS